MSDAPEPSTAARGVFGPRLPLARTYAGLLAGEGIVRGLLGPREVPRLWDRHLVNSALLTELVPADAHIVDVGSGAGLPGLAMAIRRPDLTVTLVEPLLRRSEFLTFTVESLALGGAARVVRGRAESREVGELVGQVDWVVARAVARLDRLVEWCLPLLTAGGSLLALKGATVMAEVDESRPALRRLGAGEVEVRELTAHGAAEPSWAVVVRRDRAYRSSRRGRST